MNAGSNARLAATVFAALWLAALPNTSGALPPDFVWARQSEGTNAELGFSIAVVPAGGIYVGGYFNSGLARFGTTSLTNRGDWDVFIVKYTLSGDVLWARQAGGSDDDRARAVAADAEGNCYVTGFFRSTNFTIGGLTLTNNAQNGNAHMFVAKYDPEGSLLWAKRPQVSFSDYAEGIAVDEDGNAYVAGQFSGANTYGATILTSVGGADALLIKYDPAGNVLWAKSAGGASQDGAASVAVDTKGNCYLSGGFQSAQLNFGPLRLTNSSSDGYNWDIFIARYSPAGAVQWVQHAGGDDIDSVHGAAVDRAGCTFITGEFTSTECTFGNLRLDNTQFYNYAVYLAKFDTNGEALWVRKVDGERWDYGRGVAVDTMGSAYITGYFQSTNLDFGGIVLTNIDAEYWPRDDVFVAKYSSAGDLLWATRAGGTNADEAFSIAVDAAGDSYTTGFFLGTNIIFGSTALTSGYLDTFVAKINSDIPRLSIERCGNDALLTWPAFLEGFQLENTPALLPLANWEPVNSTPVIIENRNVVSNALIGPPQLFRLRKF